MMRIELKKISTEQAPWDLLILADPCRDIILRYLSRGQIYLGLQAQKTVGVFVLVENQKQIFELMNIAIHPEAQGQGYGSELLRLAIQTVQAQDGKKLLVGTGNSSLSQLAFYQKQGFRIVGVEPNYFTKNYPAEIVENGIICRDLIRLEYLY